MNNLNNKFQMPGSSSLPRARSTNSRIRNLVSATFLAGLVLFSGSVKASSILVNPGAETGDLSGWHVSATGYIFAVSTNIQINGAGSGNVLAHSGSYVFQLFDTTADSAFIYQDFAADPGSQWSGSVYAITYASNYFSPGADAHLQVVFYDVSNNVVPSTNSSSGTAGTYGSIFLDPNGSPDPVNITWITNPPMAVDTSGWLLLQATNLYSTDPATENTFEPPLAPITPVLTAPPGTAYVRYQLEFDNLATGGGAVYWDDADLEKIMGSDPDITNPPVAVKISAGLSTSFVVGASRAQKGERLTYQWQKDGTNLPTAGGVFDISGPTTNATLLFTNVQGPDSGLYAVVATDITTNTPPVTNSIRSVPVPLTVQVLSPLQKVNKLSNAGFEGNPLWPGWIPFNGSYFAVSTNVYGTATNTVNIFDGTSVALIGANGDRDNGVYQTVPAQPGTVWKAGGYAYVSSANDFDGGNTERIQIWFKDVNGVTINTDPTYESFKIYGLAYTNSDTQYTNIDTSSSNFGQVGLHAQLPRDQWVFLQITNVANNGGVGLGDDIPYTTLSNGDFVMPADAHLINYQIYELVPNANDVLVAPPYPGVASDAVYWDDQLLIQVTNVPDLRATVSGGNANLTFSAGPGLDYAVLYKTNLTDPNWIMLTNNVMAPLSWQTNTASVGTSYPVTVSDPIAGQSRRFYKVQAY